LRVAAAAARSGTAIAPTHSETDPGKEGGAMATMYLMSLEDRVELARGQIDRVTIDLKSLLGERRLEDVQQAVNQVTSRLQDIRELIGK
jgi:hypothetical protein